MSSRAARRERRAARRRGIDREIREAIEDGNAARSSSSAAAPAPAPAPAVRLSVIQLGANERIRVRVWYYFDRCARAIGSRLIPRRVALATEAAVLQAHDAEAARARLSQLLGLPLERKDTDPMIPSLILGFIGGAIRSTPRGRGGLS